MSKSTEKQIAQLENRDTKFARGSQRSQLYCGDGIKIPSRQIEKSSLYFGTERTASAYAT